MGEGLCRAGRRRRAASRAQRLATVGLLDSDRPTTSVRSSLKGSTVYPIMVRTIVGLSKEGFDRFDRQMIPKMRRLE